MQWSAVLAGIARFVGDFLVGCSGSLSLIGEVRWKEFDTDYADQADLKRKR